MNIAEIMAKMIAFSNENIHDIDHLHTLQNIEGADYQILIEADSSPTPPKTGTAKKTWRALSQKPCGRTAASP